LFGVLIGAALFFAPFGFGFLFFIFFLFLIFRGRRYYYSNWDYRHEIVSIDGRDAYYERANAPQRKINIH
jgi:hypothetical protein